MKKYNLTRYTRLVSMRLKKLQKLDGSWAENNFINALVAYSLSEMGAPKEMLEKSVDFILSQKKSGWTWNYHPNAVKSKNNKIYPDDLDDTFCSLIAIHKIRPGIIDHRVLKRIMDLLKNTESAKDGPYFTWMNKKWHDIDPIVNANISYFCSSAGIATPKLTNYIDECLEKDSLDSKYYHNPFLAHYFIARNYRGSKRNFLIQKIRQGLEAKNGPTYSTSLANTALAACALLRIETPIETVRPLIEKIIEGLGLKRKNLGEPLYIERIIAGKNYYAHSEAFTLSLCGEAISLCLKADKKLAAETTEKELFQEIINLAERRCKSMPYPLQKEALATMRKIIENDGKRNIVLLPYRVTVSSEKYRFVRRTFVFCGLLSLYGWMAYSIYDRIIDGKEDQRRLPTANVFHREMMILCGKISNQKEIGLCRKMFDMMDCAELCEHENRLQGVGKLPSEKQTMEKSIGLAVPCLLSLSHAGIFMNGTAMNNCIKFFRHYIFAKQMSDDIRDWCEDIKNEINTRVTARIRNTANMGTCTKKITCHALIPSAKEIIKHSLMAKRALKASGIFSENSFLFNFVGNYEGTAKQFILKNQHHLHNTKDKIANSS